MQPQTTMPPSRMESRETSLELFNDPAKGREVEPAEVGDRSVCDLVVVVLRRRV